MKRVAGYPKSNKSTGDGVVQSVYKTQIESCSAKTFHVKTTGDIEKLYLIGPS